MNGRGGRLGPIARRLAPLAAVWWLASCAADGTSPRGADVAPAPLLASEDLPGDFLLQQQVRFRWEGGEGQVDAAVQSACGELVIVLLTPYGTRGTVIRQRGRQVEVTGERAAQLPFAPERILLDVQRTYFVPVSDPAPSDGVHESERYGQRIEERWAGGRLRERVFHPTSEDPDRIHVRYPDGATASELPRTASLDSERFAYHLDVTTLARQPIECLR